MSLYLALLLLVSELAVLVGIGYVIKRWTKWCIVLGSALVIEYTLLNAALSTWRILIIGGELA